MTLLSFVIIVHITYFLLASVNPSVVGVILLKDPITYIASGLDLSFLL